MALIPQRELERFFAEVGPRLETAQTLDDELDRQLARRFNVFRYLRTDEMGLSRIIADLLDPVGDHGQGAAFLKLLAGRLDFAKDVNPSDLSNAAVKTERRIEGGRRIDIVVEIDSEHCLAIENKSNSAPDQERQVEDYLRWLKDEYSHSLLVYLSPTGNGPSEGSVAREVIEDLATRVTQRFVIMPCRPSEISSDGSDNGHLTFSLVDWLADCRRICDVDRLRWYLREAETYCRQRYRGNVVTDSKKSAIGNFLRKDSNNLATAMAIHETWPEVARQIKSEFLQLILQHLPEDMIGYGDERFERYICIYRKCWRPYVVDGQEAYTTICMQAESKGCTNWDIGISSPDPSSVSGDDRERSERLHEEVGKLSKSFGKNQESGWPWWEWCEKYRYWDSLIPQLHNEPVDGSGEIVRYFVGKFKEISDRVILTINSIDGS